MMRPFFVAATIVAQAIAGLGAATAQPATPSFMALAYHNVEDESDPDQSYLGLTTDKLVAQLSWLQRNGYHPVGIDDLLAARDNRKSLPDKAVLLTFDDGFESFYTRVLPILQVFRYPAVLAVVGAWLAGGPDATVSYMGDKAPATASVQFGDLVVQRDVFLSWDQIREIAASGLVEIASHSDDAHHGTPANPQGNSEPAVTTRRYDPAAGIYQDPDSERRAVDADSEKMARKIEAETGK